MDEPFPLPVRLDADARRLDGGRVLLGGSPATLFRLGRRGARAVDAIERGEPVEPSARPFVERLLDVGAVHPVPPRPGPPAGQVTVVVPAYGPLPAGTVAGCTEVAAATIVVDDASPEPIAADGATVVRHAHNRGPAAARNTGLARVTTEFVAFLDTDCTPPRAWIADLLVHFADPRVALVAPRVISACPPGTTAIARYEAVRSPLDAGPRPARVAPGTRVAYVPAAALVARTAALRDIGGFDETLRSGEDVDLVWRLDAAGWRVRYDPSVCVTHRARAGLAAFVHQRAAYGASAGPLARRHGTALAPVRATVLSLGGWSATVGGRPLAAVALPLLSVPALAGSIGRGAAAARLALSLTVRGHLVTGRQLASAIVRPWWPLAAVAALVSRRARVVLVLAAGVLPMADYLRERPALDPLRYLALRLLDDVAYGTGVWRGAVAARRAMPLVPAVIALPFRRRDGSVRRAPLRARPPTPPAPARPDPGPADRC